MRAWLLLTLLAIALPREAMQDARPVDPALVQKFVDADSAERRRIFASLTGDTTPFRVAVLDAGARQAKQGRPKDAIRTLEAALELSAMVDAPRTAISAMISLGMVYGQAGDYTVAVRYLNGALDRTEAGRDDDLIAAAANNLGNIHRRRGEYDKALDVQERALASNLSAKREPQAARTLNNIGMIYELQGNFRLAIDYYLRSLELKERLGPPDEVISTLGNIGSIYTLQGNHPQAIDYLERSLALAEKVNNPRLAIGVLLNIGSILMESGQLDAASARLLRARDLAEKAGYAEQLAGALTGLANVEIERRRWPQATGFLRRARTILEGIGDPPALGRVFLSLARIEVDRGNHEAGAAYAKQGRDAFASVGRPLALIDAELLYGEALTGLRRWDEAIGTFENAIALTERSLDLLAGSAEDRYRFLEASTNAYVGLAHAYATAGRGRDALAAAERGRARTLLDMLSAGHAGEEELSDAERDRRIELDTALSALNERLAAERQRAGAAGRPDPALTTELDRVRRTRDEFYLGLDARHPRLRFARGEAPVLSARELAATLPPRSALVEFIVGPRVAWVMVLVPQAGREPRLVVKAAGLPSSRLLSLAETFTRQVATRDLSFSVNGRALYDALFGPIDPEISGVDHVIVVPHGGLWEVPFQALQTPRGKFVVEEHAIAYAPSASALKALDSRRHPRAAQPRVIAFGDPRVTVAGVAALPNAAREAREVAAVYGANTIVATDADATEGRFRELAPRADIVHIATHGVLDNTSPLFSYVMLSGNGRDRRSDGRLEGRELINMELGAELVVLSACETALGRISSGEGVVGLSWALFAAGASTTAVSLWPVDSASTTELMSAFHRERRQLTSIAAAAPTAQALRSAQRRSLARPESRHPFYWAGFVVVGVP